MIPDHGRDIDDMEFSSLDAFSRHLERCKRIVSKWPAWKQNLLVNSDKSQWACGRIPIAGAHTYPLKREV